MLVERDFVIQSLQNPLSIVTQKLQTDAQTPSFVRQTLQNTTENTAVVTQNEKDEKLVLQNSLQEEDENDTFVRQMESSPFYEKIKPYLPLLSRQLHLTYEVDDDTKKKISDEQGIPKAKVNSFIYEFRNEIESVDFEIPDKNDRSVEKHYNSVMKKMV